MSESEELYDINNLKYSGFSRLSLVESGGVYKTNFADQNLYESNKGTELVCTIQSNQDFVYGPNSYLRMDVKVDNIVAPGGGGFGFRNSTACSLFNRFLLESKSGGEIERCEALNKAVRACLPWKHGKDYDALKGMSGQPPVEGKDDANAEYALNDPADGKTATGVYRRVVVPLWWFSGLFAEETLIPSMLISGMRVRLSFAPAAQAIALISGTPTGAITGTPVFSIRDPVIMLDTYSLGLSVRDNLLEASQGAEGLPFTYKTLYYQSADSKTQAHTLQLNKSVARCERVWTQIQSDAADSLSVDNLGSQALNVFEYQTRCGDHYSPFQVLQVGQENNAADVQRNCSELYINNLQNSQGHVGGMLYGSGISDPYRPVSVSLSEFSKSSAENDRNCTIVQSLNQSAHVGASGLAVNNSRTLEQRFRFTDNSTRNINAWMEYCKMASVYPTRTIIAQ